MRIHIHRKFFWLAVLLILALLVAGCQVAPNSAIGQQATPQLPQPKTLTDPTWIAIDKAIQKDVAGREDVLAYLMYNVTIDSVKFADNGNLAVVFTALVDKTSGQVQSAEPGLVIAHKGSDGEWTATVQADSNFAAELQALPDGLLSAEQKEQYMPAMQQVAKDSKVYTGYHLPWAGGESKYLTGSIGHVLTYKSCPDTCLYAFDFADGTMFPVAAAKAGVVKYAEWEYPNGNTTNANYLVVEDDTTTPTTYMVYYHLAQNSIDPRVRTPGAKVYQGEYLANADDTGASTGNHLHFMVHADPNSVWGTSVDITFEEVTVNGGRPRTCAEAAAYPDYGSQCMPNNLYTSHNGSGDDTTAPTGGITLPTANSTITASSMTVAGWMSDDSGAATTGQLMYSVAGGTAQAIGPTLSGDSFTTSIDLCSANIPDGDFSLSLVVTDAAGNSSAANTGLTALKKQYTCTTPPADCTPGKGQAALFSQAGYQGKCQMLDLGEYDSLASQPNVQNGQTNSVLVGSNTSVLLYSQTNFGGVQELLQASDDNLSDNSIGPNSVSSVKVIDLITPPAAPTLTLPSHATSEEDVTLSWTTADGVDTRATLSGPNSYSQTQDWQSGGVWNVGTLAAGDYTLKLEARNLAGVTTESQGFTIYAPAPLPDVTLAALPEQSNSTAIPLSWTVNSSADSVDHFEIQVQVDGGEASTWATQPAASARKTIYDGELGHSYAFRIRGVQANGKAADFASLAQVSTVISASCQEDGYEGVAPGDDAATGATLLTTGQSQQHNWCGIGDVDWVKFTATQGQSLRLTTTDADPNSAAIIQLYDTDGVTLLGQNYPADANSGAALDWTAPADGTYLVELSPKDSAIVGTDTAYTVEADVENTVQTAPLVCGSVAIPVVLGGAYTLVSKSIQKKKTAKRAGWD